MFEIAIGIFFALPNAEIVGFAPNDDIVGVPPIDLGGGIPGAAPGHAWEAIELIG